MASRTIEDVAADWAAATAVSASAFDFTIGGLVEGVVPPFCAACPVAAAGGCDPAIAHQFGSYEAERWGGQYIYYCPASLVFVATLAYDAGVPAHSLISGPVRMEPVEDLLPDTGDQMRELVLALPGRTPSEVNGMARVQQLVCASWDTAAAPTVGTSDAETSSAQVGADSGIDWAHAYPFEEERRLVDMIRRGDRVGAAQLINQLLAVLYLSSRGNLTSLREGSAELITLFSRAAIQGGADAAAIFGEKLALSSRLAGFQDLDDLSTFLVSVFHRFVGYVFDFSRFQHADALHRVVSYVRAHYPDHIALPDVAREVWLSPSYLSSVFSAEMGMSFTAYVQTVRVEKSKELLLGTRKSVGEIAAETGFADQSYFTKVFTRSVGISPAKFRRQRATETTLGTQG
jgi:AraC-like DNA-binding protein